MLILPRRRAIALAAVACLLALAAVLPGAALASSSGARLASPGIVWGTCPPMPADYLPTENLECGRLAVPLDYQNPTGRQIELMVTRWRAADPQKRRGVLLFDSGGPGGANYYLPSIFNLPGATVISQDVRDRYDFIGVDPRGIGYSTPVTCGLSKFEAERAYVPLTEPGGFDATAAFVKDVADRCAAKSGDLLPYMTTANTARDMERVRIALGEAKLNYVGWSYGTYLGAVYASLFPNQTDRFLLDSNINPNWVWRKQFRAWGLAGDPQLGQDPRVAPRFNDFTTWAAARDAELHFGATPAAVRATYFDLLAQVSAHPVEIGDQEKTFVDGPMFRELTFGGLTGPTVDGTAGYWKAVRAALALPPATRPTGGQPGPGEPPVDNLAAGGLAISCGDVAWPRSVDTYKTDLATDRSLLPVFGELGSNIWPCAFWHSTPREPLVPLSSSGPRSILLIQNLRDPSTPYAGGVAMRAALGQRASLTTVDGGGHTVYILDGGHNTCANDTGTAFLVNGTLPGDKFCAADAPAAAATATAKARSSSGAATALSELRRKGLLGR